MAWVPGVVEPGPFFLPLEMHMAIARTLRVARSLAVLPALLVAGSPSILSAQALQAPAVGAEVFTDLFLRSGSDPAPGLALTGELPLRERGPYRFSAVLGLGFFRYREPLAFDDLSVTVPRASLELSAARAIRPAGDGRRGVTLDATAGMVVMNAQATSVRIDHTAEGVLDGTTTERSPSVAGLLGGGVTVVFPAARHALELRLGVLVLAGDFGTTTRSERWFEGDAVTQHSYREVERDLALEPSLTLVYRPHR